MHGEMLQSTHGRDATKYPWERCYKVPMGEMLQSTHGRDAAKYPWERCYKVPMGRSVAQMSGCLHVFYMVIIFRVVFVTPYLAS